MKIIVMKLLALLIIFSSCKDPSSYIIFNDNGIYKKHLKVPFKGEKITIGIYAYGWTSPAKTDTELRMFCHLSKSSFHHFKLSRTLVS